MKIWIKGLAEDDLSKIRGIGSYVDMAKEAIERYGEKYNLFLDQKESKTIIQPGFSPYQRLSYENGIHNIVVIHDLIPIKFPKEFKAGLKGYVINLLNRFQLKKYKGVITDSETVKQELIEYFKFPPNKVEVVYPAAKRVFETKQYLKDNITGHLLPKKYLLYVGDVTWNKNLMKIANAVIRAKLELVLVGKALQNSRVNNNIWLKSFNEFKSITKNKPNFHFLGFITDLELAKIYKQAVALLLPSIDEGFGLPWLEASYYETVSIVSNIPIFKEITKGGAIYVNPTSESSIVRAIESVWQDNTLNNIRKKQKAAIKYYSQEEFCKSLKQAILKLIN
jgi:glycosyltransferase involved in cell wall biosynthesis